MCGAVCGFCNLGYMFSDWLFENVDFFENFNPST